MKHLYRTEYTSFSQKVQFSSRTQSYLLCYLLHYVWNKTPTHVFFYISVENVSICTKFSGNVQEELSIPSMQKPDTGTHCYHWRHADVIFTWL